MSGVVSVLMMSPSSGGGGGGSLAATVNPTTVFGFNIGYGTVTTSEPVYVLVTGQAPPVSVLWTKVSGDAIIANTPTVSYTYFSGAVAPGDLKSAVYKCVVTDQNGSTDSTTVTINLYASDPIDIGGGVFF